MSSGKPTPRNPSSQARVPNPDVPVAQPLQPAASQNEQARQPDPQSSSGQPGHPGETGLAPRHARRVNKPGQADKVAAEVIPLAADPLLGGAMQLVGCTTVFEPGWETDAWSGMTSLCRPMQKDVYGCSADCWWPAQVPDELSNYQGWSEQCGNVEQDWSKLNFVE